MSDKDLLEALKRIIEKELSSLGKLIPKDVVSNIERQISPKLEKVIEQSGYVKKSKYENLERIINDLEKRIDELEKNRRNLYAGGIGYFTPNNEFDTCIALRTALIKDNKITILVNEAELGSNINPETAESEYLAAKDALEKADGRKAKIETNLAFKRARARYQVNSRA